MVVVGGVYCQYTPVFCDPSMSTKTLRSYGLLLTGADVPTVERLSEDAVRDADLARSVSGDTTPEVRWIYLGGWGNWLPRSQQTNIVI